MSPPTDRTVLVVFHEAALGGATLSILRVVPLLRQRGWSFIFWAPSGGQLQEELERQGLEVHGGSRPVAYSLSTLRVPPGRARRLGGMPGYFASIGRLVRERRPAVVHANSLFSIAEAAAARAAGGRVLLHVHEIVPAGWKGATARLAARAIASERVAVSEASARTLDAGADVRVVFESVPVPDAPAEVRREPSPFVVGTVGPIGRNKGSDLFVEAASRLRADRHDVAFRMVGALRDPVEPEWGRAVVERARSLGIEHHEWCDLEPEMRSWDAFALPSRVDACPGALLQAMALGLPVVGSLRGGIPEQIGADCGLLVEPEAEALAGAIAELVDSSAERRAAMGAAGRRRVIEIFSPERQAEGLDAAYRAVAG